MNILHIGKYYPPFNGGIENTMRSLMQDHKRSGHNVFGLVHWHKTKERFEIIDDGGLEIWRIPTQLIALFVPISLFAWYYLHKFIRSTAPSVLHLHMPNLACFWLLLLPSARKVPWVVHWHSDVVGDEPDWRIKALYPIYRLFEQWILSRATKVIVTSPNYLATSQPLKAWINKCEVVPLGIDIPRHIALETEHSYEHKNVLKILCIGRLTYYKGHKHLINAISQITDSEEAQVHLDIVGNGELKTEFQHQVRNLGLTEVITFHGKVDDVELNQLLVNCDVLCLPSIERTEAFGLVLLEAMRVAKPCIVTDVSGSGMSYVVEHLKTGLVVEHSNVDALVQALTHCATHPQHLHEWGQAGYLRAQQEFSLQKVAEKVEKIYLTVCNNA